MRDRAPLLVVALLLLAGFGVAIGVAAWEDSQPPGWSLPIHGNALDCQTRRLEAENAHRAGQHLDMTPGPCLP